MAKVGARHGDEVSSNRRAGDARGGRSGSFYGEDRQGTCRTAEKASEWRLGRAPERTQHATPIDACADEREYALPIIYCTTLTRCRVEQGRCVCTAKAGPRREDTSTAGYVKNPAAEERRSEGVPKLVRQVGIRRREHDDGTAVLTQLSNRPSATRIFR